MSPHFDLNGLDWVLLAIALFGVVRGLWRGAISQIFGIVGALGGFVLAAYFHESVAARLAEAFPNLKAPQMLSFAFLFFLTWFIAGGLGFWLSRSMHKKGMEFPDRLLGAAIGFGKSLILAVILISAMTLFVSTDSPLLRQSQFAPYIQTLAQMLVQTTPERFQVLFEQKRRELIRYWSGEDTSQRPSSNESEERKETQDAGNP